MKIRDRLRSLVVRYLVGPATMVPPKSKPAHRTPLPGLSFPDRPVTLTKPALFDDAKMLGMSEGTLDRETRMADFMRPKPVARAILHGVNLDGSTDIGAEVERRLATIDIPADASHEEVQRMVEEAIGDLPGVRLAGVIKKGDPGYDAMATTPPQAFQSQSMGDMAEVLRGLNMESLPWSVWARWMEEAKAPAGWSTCRFGARWGDGDGTVGQMFGVTRGDFGVYTRPFYVCGPIHDEQVMAALIHLPTGTGVGVFLTRDMAVEAGELAMALGGIDWRTSIDPTRPETWIDIRARLGAAWSAAGLHIAPFHAHSEGVEDEIAVWMSTTHTKMAGKPKRFGDLS